MNFSQVRKTAVLVFLGLSACYLSLSPGSIAGQGYTIEEINSGLRMLAIVSAWLKGLPRPPMLWSRHGPVPVLFDLPFIGIGKILVSPDFVLSFQPVLLTAALLTVLFLWLRRVCSPGMSLLLTLTGAFGTLLWPYAYISLETKQSFFLLLAGYLALAEGRIRSWPRLLLFAATCGLAITVKSIGFTLGPAIAYLVYLQFRDDWRLRRAQVLVVLFLIWGIWAEGIIGRTFYWAPIGGGFVGLRIWLIESPLEFFSNAVGIFGSPTKGLFIYAPILLVSFYAIPRTFRTHRQTAIFALLVAGCTLTFLSMLTNWADEVWGCRYMHVAIAPLLVCIGAAWPRFQWRRLAPLVALAVVGLVISFLGAFYYYGQLDSAATKAGQNTLDWITSDRHWNHVEFNGRLFKVWLEGGTTPVVWTPKQVWVWSPPPDAQPWKSVDLREYCQPQSFMLRLWDVPKRGMILMIFRMYQNSLVVGLLLLTWVFLRTVKEQRVVVVGDLRVASNEALSRDPP